MKMSIKNPNENTVGNNTFETRDEKLKDNGFFMRLVLFVRY